MDTEANVALIAACQQGDPRAFQEIFEIYKDRIYALCRHMAGNAEDAEDLTQEVFISAFKNIGGFRAEAAFGTWLYRIATNSCLGRLRKWAPERVSFDALSAVDAAPAAPGPNPEDMVVRKELTRRMEAGRGCPAREPSAGVRAGHPGRDAVQGNCRGCRVFRRSG